MSKVYSFLLICLLTLSLIPRDAFAFSCSLRTIPDPLIAPSGRTSLKGGERIQYNIQVSESANYNVYLRHGGAGPLGHLGDISFRDLRLNTEGILVNSSNQPPDIVTFADQIFDLGSHSIDIEQTGVTGNNHCQVFYSILPNNENEQVQTCDEILGPKEANPNTDIKFSGKLVPTGKYRFFLPNYNLKVEFDTNGSGNFSNQNLGKLATGTYIIKLQKYIKVALPDQGPNKFVNDWVSTNCNISSLTVSNNPSPDTTPTKIGSGTPITPGTIGGSACIPGTDCVEASGLSCLGGNGVKTAIGCIPTDPLQFVNTILKFSFSIAGGIAFLLMVFGAIQMVTSAGNPEALNQGKDRFTSAILGLLFILFSVLLLKIIGVDILNIPGFS